MQLSSHVKLMAEYNQWMNKKLYEAAATLSTEQLTENRGAFFGSILATLSHIGVADVIWMKRFAACLPAHQELDPVRALSQPGALNDMAFSNLADLLLHRQMLDAALAQFVATLTEAELAMPIAYTNTKGVSYRKNLFSLLMHVFNHQTHHRGQVTTLLSQSGIDVGVTDLAAIIPEYENL
jgi:uncharacterized damage-inducible protein DinB